MYFRLRLDFVRLERLVRLMQKDKKKIRKEVKKRDADCKIFIEKKKSKDLNL